MTQSLSIEQPREEVLVLRPTRGWGNLDLKEVWLYRELVYFLTWRDLKVRYKQTLLGAAWAVIQPVVTMVVFSIFFDRLLKVPSDNIPYPIFSYTALLPWGVFSKALTDAGRSLVLNRTMITKVYFPRLIVPLASVLASVVDFAIAFVILLVMMGYYHIMPRAAALWALPFLLILSLVTALGVGLWLSALNVLYRDIGYILPFLTQLWFYVTPIVYPSSKVPARWQMIYALNPLVGVVEGFRWALLRADTAPGLMVAISALIALLLLVSGLFYFRRMERTFADMV
jgi:lipopolysaccharide transport system permease protein